MKINQVAYAGSYPKESKCPAGLRPEYAFIGRSNVGKSSLINCLVERKNLARTSSKPGKTQLLNYYLVDGDWFLVDLPGYGYAKISKTKRQEWERMIRGYLNNRGTLQYAFVLIDSNIPPQQIDLDFINSLGEERVPFVIAYTKADRLKPEQLEENLTKIREALLEHWEELPPQFVTAADTGRGAEEILAFIQQANEDYQNRL